MKATTSQQIGCVVRHRREQSAGRRPLFPAVGFIVLVGLLVLPASARSSQQEQRLFEVSDIFELKNVGDARISPDGEWVAFTVSQMNADDDSSDTDVWMVSMDGGEPIRLTTSDRSESSPRWSPDGRWLAFMSGRDGNRNQVWLLPRAGGEAQRLTDVEQGVSGMAWSPDATRLALLIRDPEETTEGEEEDEGAEGSGGGGVRGGRGGGEVPKPIVIDRLQFKRDGAGYLDSRKTHIYAFDVEAKELTQITEGPFDEGSPVWSPDGTMLAFVSNRTDEPDANANSDIWLVEARAGAEIRQLTTSPGSDGSPRFSPDGRYIVYTAGGDPADIWYATNDVAIIEVAGGEPRILTEGLDRNVSRPTVTTDGSHVAFLLEEYGTRVLSALPITGGDIATVLGGERTVRSFDIGPNGELVVLETQPDYPSEISKVVGGVAAMAADASAGETVRLTRMNDDFLAGIDLAPVRAFETTSSDGVTIQAFLTLPPNAPPGERLPTLLRIHGGPVSQFSHQFSTEWQILAAQGYAVVAANPRGSSGRGRDFSRAIWADWGNKDFDDVNAAVDAVIEMGVADPDRLGVGGWSYGGILTNYVITQTGRFKAAISGASEVNYTANYGHDHYQRQWEAELGLPWENPELWLRISPFFHVADVSTPTLVMGGQQDWNVPVQNSDQLYQALRRLGVPTQLVVYPGQSHGIRRPSYQVDRYERYIAWYDEWVKGEAATTGGH